MKQSKVKSVDNANPWKDGIVYYNLEMENGDKISIGKKSEPQVGWDMHYELTGDVGQQEYTKAKAVQPPQENRYSSPSSTKNDKTSDSILYQVCLKGVMDYFISVESSHGPHDNNCYFTSESINNLALDIAKKAKENIEKL